MALEKKIDKKLIGFWGWPALVTLAVFVADQASKIWIDKACEVGWCKEIIPGFFNLVHWRNTGCAWGMFNQNTWILAIVSSLAFAAVILFFKKETDGNRNLAVAWAMLEGGIAGNMVDRIFRNSVVDFLDFHIFSAHWPAFNIADSAICVSVAILLLLSFRMALAEKKSKSGAK